MDDLVRVAKGDLGMGSRAGGRPPRTTFALRCYSGSRKVIMSLPPRLVKSGDRIEFYVSATGFAVLISPDGDRAISSSNGHRSANIPLAVFSRMNLRDGTNEVPVYEDRGGGMIFFPFDQFNSR